jgi:hypothetical protein
MTKSIKVHTRRRTAAAPPVLLHYATATEETAMQRVTITIDDELDEELDRYMRARL